MPALDPVERRARDWDRLTSETFDVLVVGGGITGVGCLLDAASRGLRAALVEREDIASGTSSRSSGLIHGGLRYLEQFRFGLVREALAERALLLRLAPHLVRLEPFLFPVFGTPLHRPFYATGLTLYDMLGAAGDGGRHRFVGVEQALELAPALRRERLRGGFLYHDGVEDDARFALAVARTARSIGGLVLTRAQAVEVLREGERVSGVRVRDRSSGDETAVSAKAVIDATGPWSADAEGPFAAGSSTGRSKIRPSRGTHVLVSRSRIPGSTGLTLRLPGRVAFLIPWPSHWLIGTTDRPYEGRPEDIRPTAEEVDEILETVNRRLTLDLTRADLLGAYAGVRPLVSEGSARGSTVKVSREHRVRVDADGLTRIQGGKYTTYRLMARDAVDAALGAGAPPSATDNLPIAGAAEPDRLARIAENLARRLESHDVEASVAAGLVVRHGAEATDVVDLGQHTGHLRLLVTDSDLLEAEIVWSARHELALSIEDFLARRTRLGLERPDRAEDVAPRVAEILGGELGWDVGRQVDELEAYLASAHRQFDVP
ncbi:MAG TPA: glycerol-3-phosphate dehydrogenase/oxidase [Candidatus Limnocylindrales bacterium]